MTPEQLEAIAKRPTCCKTYGETVSLTKDERDALVAMARRYAWLRDESAGVPDGMRQIIAVQLPLPHTEDADIDLFDEALDAAIDAAMAKEQ